RTITEMGLFSTKRANTLPSMVASSSEFLSKAWSVTNGEREGHLNRAAPYTPEERSREIVMRSKALCGRARKACTQSRRLRHHSQSMLLIVSLIQALIELI